MVPCNTPDVIGDDVPARRSEQLVQQPQLAVRNRGGNHPDRAEHSALHGRACHQDPGNPADKAVVVGNVFKATSRSDAIDQNGECGWGDNITNPIDVRDNAFGVDPMQQLATGDFEGDGLNDEFLATGVTWWARSSVTGQ